MLSRRTWGRRSPWSALWIVIGLSTLLAGAAPQDPPEDREKTRVDGFTAEYARVATPRAEWGEEKDSSWVLKVRGNLDCTKSVAYRTTTLTPGKYDFWVEKGKGEWFYLVVGRKEDAEAPRLRALFRLYEREEGVDSARFDLKLTRRATKLKFSILAGRSEGHGNLRIIEDDPTP